MRRALFSFLVSVVLFASGVADAAVRRICKVSHETTTGWSQEYTLEVTFMAGQELNKATRSYQFSDFENYALIWFNKDQVAILKIEGVIFRFGSEFTPADFIEAFQIISEKEATQVNAPKSRKWKIEAKDPFFWIDPRAR